MLLIEPLHFALKVHQLDAFNLQHLLPPRRRSEVRPLPSHQNPRDSLVKKTMFVENYIRDVGNGFIQILITFSSKLIFCICPRQDYSYLVFLSAYLDEHLLLQISKRQRVTRTTITGTDDQAFRGVDRLVIGTSKYVSTAEGFCPSLEFHGFPQQLCKQLDIIPPPSD